MKGDLTISLSVLLASLGQLSLCYKDVLDQCRSQIEGRSFNLALNTCQKAIHEQSDRKADPASYSESLLLLSQAQVNVGNPWMALQTLKSLVDGEDGSGDKDKVAAFLKKGLQQLCNILLKFGDFEEVQKYANDHFEYKEDLKATVKRSKDAKELYQQIVKLAEDGKWPEVEPKCKKLIDEYTPYFGKVFDLQIKAHYRMGDLDKAIETARYKTRIETDTSGTKLVIAKLYLSKGEVKLARDYLNDCLRINPEQSTCMKLRKKLKEIDEEVEAVEKGGYLLREATEKLEGLLKTYTSEEHGGVFVDTDYPEIINGPKAKILRLLCQKQARRRLVIEAEVTCAEARKLDKSSGEDFYLLILADLKSSQGEFDEAFSLLKQAQSINPSSGEIRDALKKVDKEKREKMKTKYYDTLGVNNRATSSEIKKAHSKLVKRFHPDKQRGEEAKRAAEKKVQEINAAFEVLGNKEKRRMYDAGIDPNDPNAAQGFPGGNPFGGGAGGFRGGPGGAQFVFDMEDLAKMFGGQFSNAAGGGGNRRGGGGFHFHTSGGGGGGRNRGPFRDDL